MKKFFCRIICLLTILCFIFPQHAVYAAVTTGALSNDEITISNNVDAKDSIYVLGLTAGDVVKVYNAPTGGKMLCQGTVANGATDITVYVSQLGSSKGSVYVSVTSKGMGESSRTEANYDAEPISDKPLLENIQITNNVGKPDTIYVCGLAPGDTIKIYNKPTGGVLFGSATVPNSTTEVTKTFNQLGYKGGTLYISVKSKGMLESDRVEVNFPAENQSSQPLQNNIQITNNAGKPDVIHVCGLAPGDTIKIYNKEIGGSLLGSATVNSNSTEITKTFNELGSQGGTVYISVTSTGMRESFRTPAAFSAESRSSSILASNVTITNNFGKADTIFVKGLSSGDKIIVYSAQTGGSVIGTGTVGEFQNSVTINVSQLGVSRGTVYISLTSQGMYEGPRSAVDYLGENQSDAIDSKNIVVTNNAGQDDIVQVKGVSAGEIIKVYDADTDGNLLGTLTVPQYSSQVIIKIPQLNINGGEVYVSRTSANKAESDRTGAIYAKEGQSNVINSKNVVITNNALIADTVKVTGLSPNDIVNVYDSPEGGNLLGSATALTYGGDATVSINQLGSKGGNVYITLTSVGKLESNRTQVGFNEEAQSNTPRKENVVIANNLGIASQVTVDGLKSGDIVNVYDDEAGSKLLGTGTVAAYNTEVTVSVDQLSSDGGSVYVSSISVGKMESEKQEVEYGKKSDSNAPLSKNIIVKNNADIAGTVTIKGVQPNDVVKIYDSATNGNLLASGTVASGSRSAIISLTQLNSDGGKIYVSVTSSGKKESSRTEVSYSAESKSEPVNKDNVTIVNDSDAADTIEVTGLSAKDVVNVYSSNNNDDLLGTATVADGDSSAIVSISQLGTNAGSVWISVKRYGRPESDRVQSDYVAESVPPQKGNISVVNNAVIYDTVTVTGLTANDIVNVYDAKKNGNLLGSGSVLGNDNSVTISIPQLGTGAGKIYISVTNSGRGESSRTEASYIAEQTSTAPFKGDINIVNNLSGTADIITVNNVSANSLVKVYDAATNGNLIGQATVPANSVAATITVNQLGVSAGTVYVSVTSPGKNESSRTSAQYIAEK